MNISSLQRFITSCALASILLGTLPVGAFQQQPSVIPRRSARGVYNFQPRPTTAHHAATLQQVELDLLDIDSLPLSSMSPLPDGIPMPQEQEESPRHPDSSRTGPPKATSVSQASSRPNSPSLSTWKRRLMTKEDKKNLHKISGIGFVLSSAALVGTGVATGFTEAPDFLGPITGLFTATTVVQSMSSIEMALNHRKNDIAARNGFVASAVSSVFVGMQALWVSPFAPDIFDAPYISETIFGLLSLAGLVGDVDSILRIPDILDSRNRKKIKGKQDESSIVQDLVAYIFPVLWGIPLYLIGLWRMVDFMDAPGGTRAAFLESCLHDGGILSNQIPIFYAMVITTCSVSYGSLAVTLRDKKLITKNQEQMVVGTLSLIAAASAVHANGWL